MPKRRADLQGLEQVALEQGGYFDGADAAAHGFSDQLVRHHLRTGRFERIYPGVYRLAIAPPSPHDDLLLAWVWSNRRGVISHDSALALYGLSDLLPSHIHLTVPSEFGRTSAPYVVHRVLLPEADKTTYEGVPVTSAARAIVDAAADGADLEQIARAASQAVERGLATWSQIDMLARRPHYHGRRVALPAIEAARAAA
jgi:predicted transcriptional regulator of viral defense system